MKIIYVCLDTKSRSISWSKSHFLKTSILSKGEDHSLSESRPSSPHFWVEERAWNSRREASLPISNYMRLKFTFHGIRVQNEANEHTKSFENIEVLKKVSYRLDFSSFLFFSVRTLRGLTFVFAKNRKKKEKKEIVASKCLTFEIRMNV